MEKLKGAIENRAYEKNRYRMMTTFFGISLMILLTGSAMLYAESTEVPGKGMVTMVDLGAKKCIPCKMMAPILAKLEKEYAGRAAIVFLDVWEDPGAARQFGIRGIPTQIFFDTDGKEVYRHAGFLAEEEIVRRLKDMGVKK